MIRATHVLRGGILVSILSLAAIASYGQALGSFSSSNGGGSGSNSSYFAELWIGTNCTAPFQSSPGVTGSNCFEAGSIQIEPSNVGVPDTINAGDNANFAALAGFFTTTPGASYMANVAMGNGGSATQSNVSLSSKFGGGNPPYPGDVVTSFVYTLTRINSETSSFASFNYSFEVDGGLATPEPAGFALFGAGIAGLALFGASRPFRRS